MVHKDPHSDKAGNKPAIPMTRPIAEVLAHAGTKKSASMNLPKQRIKGLIASKNDTLGYLLKKELNPGKIASVIAEVAFVRLLEIEGWTVLGSVESTLAKKREDELSVVRIDDLSNKGRQVRKRKGHRVNSQPQEIDCVALSPDGELWVFETKAVNANRSVAQAQLFEHLERGGEVEFRNCPQLEGQRLKPKFFVFRVSNSLDNYPLKRYNKHTRTQAANGTKDHHIPQPIKRTIEAHLSHKRGNEMNPSSALNLPPEEIARLLEKHKEEIPELLEERSRPDYQVSALADVAFVSLLEEQGWTIHGSILTHHNTSHGNSLRAKRIDDKSSKRGIPEHRRGEESQSTEIDCVAVSPMGEMYIFEVKSVSGHLTNAQKNLREHLEKGGAVSFENCPGLTDGPYKPKFAFFKVGRSAQDFPVEKYARTTPDTPGH